MPYRVARASTDSAQPVRLSTCGATGEWNIPVWSLDERSKLMPSVMTHAFSSGVKEVFRVNLASGRELRATANQPFLT
jgi:replicative DNA helicase